MAQPAWVFLVPLMIFGIIALIVSQVRNYRRRIIRDIPIPASSPTAIAGGSVSTLYAEFMGASFGAFASRLRIVIPGGSGQVGQMLARYFQEHGPPCHAC